MDRITYDRSSHLLEENYYKYTVQDVEEPNLFREMFDYVSVPRVAFNHRVVPMNMPEQVWITDTTFRDGQQARSPFIAEQIVELFRLLSRLGGPRGIIRQSEFFIYTENDRRALEQCRELGLEFPEITTWIRATEKDFELVKAIGVEETGILVSCSDYHIFKKMNLTRSQAMDKYLGIVKDAFSRGIRPRCHFEDITRADFYGFVVPFAKALHDLSLESGIPVKIRCCDTMGLGVTYPGASLPRSVQGIIYGLMHYADIPGEMLEWHGHNDFYKVVTNAASAWLYGCASVNCSLLGIGERTGNCPLEAMVMEYCALRGSADGMDLSAITDIAEYMERETGCDIPPRTPFVGADFNVTRAGIHADGLLKDEEIYSIFDTGLLLNRPARVTVDCHSGLAGVAHWLNRHFKLEGSQRVDKGSDMVARIKARVDGEYAGGRTTAMSSGELYAICLAVAPEFCAAHMQA